MVMGSSWLVVVSRLSSKGLEVSLRFIDGCICKGRGTMVAD